MENDVEDPGSARVQNAAKFLHALVAVLLWNVVRFFWFIVFEWFIAFLCCGFCAMVC